MNNTVNIEKIEIKKPYGISKMGTSGLRQKQEVYNQPLFLEQFAQGVAEYFKSTTGENKNILIGGDPRKGNRKRIDIFARILIANGFRVLIAGDGLASTPAMSHGIRHLKTAGGIVLTASHNPFTDVGIKINSKDGSPALEDATDSIHSHQNSVKDVIMADSSSLDNTRYAEYIDIIKLYTEHLDSIFSLKSMKSKLAGKNIKCAFDSMHGAAGPFARSVFIDALGLDAEMLREEPREDLGGMDENGEPLHPEPDFDYIPQLISLNKTGKYDIVSAWDSDVDRRLDGGSGFFLESSDEFALFSAYSHLIDIDRLFGNKIYFCRSTVTSDAIDRMEEFLIKKFPGKDVKTVETPTGFKWIADLGNWGVEESNGVGNPFHREKDGIFSTLFLLKIILETGKNPGELMEEIWEDYGRVYFTRGEVSGNKISEKEKLASIMTDAPGSVGKSYGELVLESAGEWDYIHPETGSTEAKGAAWVLNFNDGNTIKARFSGTGSGGYTMRVYCSKYDRRYNITKSLITKPMKDAFDEFLSKNDFSGRSGKYTDLNQPDPYSGM